MMKNASSSIFCKAIWLLMVPVLGCHSVGEDKTGLVDQLPNGEYVSAVNVSSINGFESTGRDTSDSPLSDIGTTGGPGPIAAEDRVVLQNENQLLSADGNTLYINGYSQGLKVIDLSNADAPSILMERRFTWDVQSMYLHGNRLVVVTIEIPDPGVYQSRIIVFDVSMPSSIAELSETTIEGIMGNLVLMGGNETFVLYATQIQDNQQKLVSYAIAADGTVVYRDAVANLECNELLASENYLVAMHIEVMDELGDYSEIEFTTLTPIDISAGDGVMTVGEPILFPEVGVYKEESEISDHTLLLSSLSLAYDISNVNAPTPVDWDFSEDGYGGIVADGQNNAAVRLTSTGMALAGGEEQGMDTSSNYLRLYSLAGSTQTPAVVAEITLENLYFDFASAMIAENAVNVVAPDGTVETGLYLVSFVGEDSGTVGLQLVTFSVSTLTLRGRLLPTGQNYFWFPPRDGQIVGVSNTDVVRFTISDVTAPVLQSSLVTTAFYVNFELFGETGIRLEIFDSMYGRGYEPIGPRAELQTISAGKEPGDTEPDTRLETNASTLYRVGDHLLVGANDSDTSAVDIFDVTNPAKPVLAFRIDNADSVIESHARFLPQSTDSALIFTNTLSQQRGESAAFVVLDLRNPAAPVLQPALTMPEDEIIQTVFVRGTTLYYGYKKPYEKEGDARIYAKYYYKRIELADPSAPVVSAGISIPGLIIDADAEFVYTVDKVFGNGGLHAVINQLNMKKGVAVVASQLDLGKREVLETQLLDNGYLLLNHTNASETTKISEYRLSLLNVHDGLKMEGDVAYRRFGELMEANSDRAVLRVLNGVIVIDLSNPAAPQKSHYFPLCGNNIYDATLDGDNLYLIQDGIYRFEL